MEKIDKIRRLIEDRESDLGVVGNHMYTIEEEILPAITHLIRICGGDPDSEGMKETPLRVVKAWLEVTEGYQETPEEHLNVTFKIDESNEGSDQKNPVPITLKYIPVKSVCEHHVMPFFGHCNITYIPKPGGRVVGISKLVRLVNGYSKRFQIQETLTERIADGIVKVLDPAYVRVEIEAEHTCMTIRGVQALDSTTHTVSERGKRHE